MAFGRLQRSPESRPMADINVTPLVDVMLVLVAIFILTAPLLASAIRLDLPRAAGATPGAAPRALVLAVDAQGQAWLDGAAITPGALAARLAQAAAEDPATELQLRADAAVPYGRVVEIMGLAQQAGLSRIGFVAEPPRRASTP
ncbi:biopolymer transporter ExbD [Ramlibacter sp. H39-3-26]|uniref:ExbD/TolR family protein n=1 Tax=Curvibacter soli TaxID=3031331 RepID=UPI0023DB0959|nr:biopolymer transporter ExbD [Ramlibacter sp. H39-3-26]MDF1486040.1 biopolymer transporter ExbD [Ramlibacter sp. H39-3-26]